MRRYNKRLLELEADTAFTCSAYLLEGKAMFRAVARLDQARRGRTCIFETSPLDHVLDCIS